MGRRAHPWYRADRDAWYVKLGGRPVMLAKGKASKAAAEAEFHRLKAEEAKAKPRPGEGPTFGELAARYISHTAARVEAGELAPTTFDDVERRLSRFLAEFGGRPIEAIRPADVLDWISGLDGLGPTSRHDAVAMVKSVTRWAVKVGYLAIDPFAGLSKPTRRRRREEVIAPADWHKVRAAILIQEFRDLVDVMHATGCRFGEAARIEARHVDWARGIAVVEGKTTKRTGRPSVITLPDGILARLKELAAIHPTGPLLRNTRGNPWRRWAVKDQIVRIRQRTGLGGELVAQSLRHLFATDALDKGVPIATVAQLLNHADTRMVSRNYGHLAERYDHLRAAIETIRPEASAAPATLLEPSHPATTSPVPVPPSEPQPPAPQAEASPGSEPGSRPPAIARSRSSRAPRLGSGGGSARVARSRTARRRSIR